MEKTFSSKAIGIMAAIAIAAAGGGFASGMRYQSSHGSSGDQRGGMTGRNSGWQATGGASGSRQVGGTPDARARFAGAGGAGGRMGGGVMGEVLSVSDTTMTVKLPDGGSRIVLLSDSTEVTTAAKGTVADLKEGASVFVGGDANSDGSVTAKTIQLR